MREKGNYFKSLYRQYKRLGLRAEGRHALYERMVANAEHFAEWAIVYQFGDDTYRYTALENMKNTIFDEVKSVDVQMNIMELFEIVTDASEQEEILKMYLSRFTEKDDLLFVMVLSHDGAYDDAERKAIQFYSGFGKLYKGVLQKSERMKKKMLSSSFMV